MICEINKEHTHEKNENGQITKEKEINSALPEGYRWEDYGDGSGSIVGPDNKRYFSYDRLPYASSGWIEYRRSKDEEWDIFYDSLPKYKEWVNAIFREYIQKKSM